MTKALNQIIIFFPPPKSEYFFSNIGNQNIFFRKKPYPPPWKLNGPSLSITPNTNNDNAIKYMEYWFKRVRRHISRKTITCHKYLKKKRRRQTIIHVIKHRKQKINKTNSINNRR